MTVTFVFLSASTLNSNGAGTGGVAGAETGDVAGEVAFVAGAESVVPESVSGTGDGSVVGASGAAAVVMFAGISGVAEDVAEDAAEDAAALNAAFRAARLATPQA